MDLRDYVRIARRNLALLVALPVLLGVLTFAYFNRQPREYASTSSVLLRPNDQSEKSGSGAGVDSLTSNVERLLPALVKQIKSDPVTGLAAQQLGGRLTAAGVRKTLRVTSAADSNVIEIKSTTESAKSSAAIANAVAAAFIENRRLESIDLTQKAIDQLDIQIDELLTDLKGLEADTTSVGNKALIGATQNAYGQLASKRRQLEADIKLKKGEAEVVEEAKPASSPAGIQPLQVAIMAAIVGFMMAAGIALLRDLLDQRLQSRKEAEELAGAQVLAQIPLDKRSLADSTSLVSLRNPDGVVAESIRSLRVALRFLSMERELRIVLVTSAMPSDGKSTVAGNLAGSYAVGGFRTLLVSADLRRPQVDALSNEAGRNGGLAGVLGRMAEVEESRRRRSHQTNESSTVMAASIPVRRRRVEPAAEVIPGPPGRRRRAVDLDEFADEHDEAPSRNGVERVAEAPKRQRDDGFHLDIAAESLPLADNLWLLPSGRSSVNPVEILGSKVAKEFFAAAVNQFDIVIIDSPPVLPVSDALVLSNVADGVVFVTSLGQTHRNHLERGVEALRSSNARLLGLVLNRVPQRGEEKYGYYAD